LNLKTDFSELKMILPALSEGLQIFFFQEGFSYSDRDK